MVALMVILTMAGFIVIDGFVQYAQAKNRADAPEAIADRVPLTPVDLTIPGGIFLSPKHTWVQIRENGNARIGLDALIAGLVGQVKTLDPPETGSSVEAGETIFSIDSNGKRLSLTTPVSGKVKSVNAQIVEGPQHLFRHPYSSWVCEIEAADIARDLESLRIGSKALKWLSAEAERIGEFLMRALTGEPAVGTVLADGGSPSSGALEALDEDQWKEFQHRFLD